MEILGEIQNIKRDRTAVQLMNDWFNCKFHPLDNKFKKGDYVKIVYTTKDSFKNLKSIEWQLTKEEDKRLKIVDLINEKDIHKEINPQTINTILMCVKEIAVSVIINSKEYVDLNEVITKSTDQFIKSYKTIIKEI